MFIKFLPSKNFPEKISGICPNCQRMIYLNFTKNQKLDKIKCHKCNNIYEIITTNLGKVIFFKIKYDR